MADVDEKSILNASADEAKAFLLKGSSYLRLELPPYFNFEDLIASVSAQVGSRTVSAFCNKDAENKVIWPSEYDNVNYRLLVNKDGRYGWRLHALIHPVLYVLLVNTLTTESNWKLIRERFELFQVNPKILCVSIPSIPTNDLSSETNLVSRWVREVERASVELSLEFMHLFHTDIADCYGSVYTHSISWAIHEKAVAKEKKRDGSLAGNQIDRLIQGMSYGQTNGIPVGSVSMDFIAEIVLGFADIELSRRLDETAIIEYRIIRYRDDYRVFVNNPLDGETILKTLSEVLADLGLTLNQHKTFSSSDVVSSSIKPDKLAWGGSGSRPDTLLGKLLVIHQFGKEYPNSGTIEKELTKLYQSTEFSGDPDGTFPSIAAIVSDIAIRHPRTVAVCTAILAQALSSLATEAERINILNSIQKKFDCIPNTGFLELWLQRISMATKAELEFRELLCKRVIDPSINIWNSDWLIPAEKAFVEGLSFIDQKVIDELKPEIDAEEFALFVMSQGGYQ